jgi:hypothetical protein
MWNAISVWENNAFFSYLMRPSGRSSVPILFCSLLIATMPKLLGMIQEIPSAWMMQRLMLSWKKHQSSQRRLLFRPFSRPFLPPNRFEHSTSLLAVVVRYDTFCYLSAVSEFCFLILGMSLGLHQSGVSRSCWAVEKDPTIAATYQLNFPEGNVFTGDCNAILKHMLDVNILNSFSPIECATCTFFCRVIFVMQVAKDILSVER